MLIEVGISIERNHVEARTRRRIRRRPSGHADDQDTTAPQFRVPSSGFRVRVHGSGSKFGVPSSWFAELTEPRTPHPEPRTRTQHTNLERGTWNMELQLDS